MLSAGWAVAGWAVAVSAAGWVVAGAAAAASTDDRGGSRQFGWWILNFAVCIGFLWLWQRRKRHDPDEEPQG